MRYTTRQYAEALYESLEGKAGSVRERTLARFVNMLRRRGDARHLNKILVRYEEVYLQARGMVKVAVESAAPLQNVIKKEIEKALGKPIELIETVDPKLLAGIRILLNDTMLIDATASRRLESIPHSSF